MKLHECLIAYIRYIFANKQLWLWQAFLGGIIIKWISFKSHSLIFLFKQIKNDKISVMKFQS